MWMQRTFTDTPVMWEPKENAGKELKRFQKFIEEKYGLRFNDYWEFHQWSTDNTAEFWAEVYDFLGIISSKKYNKVIDINIPMDQFPEWFEGAELNFSENVLKYRDDHVALILAGEDREFEKVTYAKMYEEAELYASAFRKLGLKKNDIVVCYMSNRKEAVFAMLAAVSIGAIWTGALPLMGPQPVLNRFEQVNPTFLLTVDRFMQSGEEIDMLSKVEAISQASDPPYRCPDPNAEWNDCGSECPDTCYNLENTPLCSQQCVQGCFCSRPFVASEWGCVLPRQCPKRV